MVKVLNFVRLVIVVFHAIKIQLYLINEITNCTFGRHAIHALFFTALNLTSLLSVSPKGAQSMEVNAYPIEVQMARSISTLIEMSRVVISKY